MRSRVAFFTKFMTLLPGVRLLLILFCLLCSSGFTPLQPCANAVANPGKPVDRILIEKSKRTMSLMSGTEVLKTYKVALACLIH